MQERRDRGAPKFSQVPLAFVDLPLEISFIVYTREGADPKMGVLADLTVGLHAPSNTSNSRPVVVSKRDRYRRASWASRSGAAHLIRRSIAVRCRPNYVRCAWQWAAMTPLSSRERKATSLPAVTSPILPALAHLSVSKGHVGINGKHNLAPLGLPHVFQMRR